MADVFPFAGSPGCVAHINHHTLRGNWRDFRHRGRKAANRDDVTRHNIHVLVGEVDDEKLLSSFDLRMSNGALLKMQFCQKQKKNGQFRKLYMKGTRPE